MKCWLWSAASIKYGCARYRSHPARAISELDYLQLLYFHDEEDNKMIQYSSSTLSALLLCVFCRKKMVLL